MTRNLICRLAVAAAVAALPAVARAQVTAAPGHAPPDDTPSVKLGVTLFTDFTYTDEPPDQGRGRQHGEPESVRRLAYRTLEHLNNKYALDGRDPNSYTGILWCFGLFARPWPPDRKIFGGVRYMSSDNTARKFDLKPYYAYVERLPTISEARSGRAPSGLRSPAARR